MWWSGAHGVGALTFGRPEHDAQHSVGSACTCGSYRLHIRPNGVFERTAERRLTIDLAAGDQYLVALAATATSNWLTTTNPVLDYANAMVPNKQPNTSVAESNWQEHISGYPRITPPVPPLAPAR